MRRTLSRTFLAAAFAFGGIPLLAGCADVPGEGGAGGPVSLESEDEKTLYALGYMIGQQAEGFDLSRDEARIAAAGMMDAATGTEAKVDVRSYGQKVMERRNRKVAEEATAEKEKGKAYQAKMAQEKGAEQTESGLVFVPTTPGTGDQPAATNRVRVHYTGKLVDGTVFDSSVERGEPVDFPLGGVIKCWTEGLQKMKEGGKATLVCPSDIAYGDRGRPPKIPGGATLVFDVELIEVDPKPAAPRTISPKSASPH